MGPYQSIKTKSLGYLTRSTCRKFGITDYERSNYCINPLKDLVRDRYAIGCVVGEIPHAVQGLEPCDWLRT